MEKSPPCKNIGYRGPCEHKHNMKFPISIVGTDYMYICARCLGLKGMIPIWFTLFIVEKGIINKIQALSGLYVFLICYALTLPLVIDWLLQCRGTRHSSNFNRFFTGSLTSLSGVVMIIGYHAFWITMPIGFLWFYVVAKLGKKWKKNRPLTWGCYVCQHKLKQAFEVHVV